VTGTEKQETIGVAAASELQHAIDAEDIGSKHANRIGGQVFRPNKTCGMQQHICAKIGGRRHTDIVDEQLQISAAEMSAEASLSALLVANQGDDRSRSAAVLVIAAQ
jgi:hypothetical protein